LIELTVKISTELVNKSIPIFLGLQQMRRMLTSFSKFNLCLVKFQITREWIRWRFGDRTSH